MLLYTSKPKETDNTHKLHEDKWSSRNCSVSYLKPDTVICGHIHLIMSASKYTFTLKVIAELYEAQGTA